MIREISLAQQIRSIADPKSEGISIMNNRKGLLKVLSVLLALVTLSLFTAACGDDDESSEQNTTKPDNGWPSKITFGAVPADVSYTHLTLPTICSV